MLLVESVQTVNRLDEGFRKQYQHRCHRMRRGIGPSLAAIPPNSSRVTSVVAAPNSSGAHRGHHACRSSANDNDVHDNLLSEGQELEKWHANRAQAVARSYRRAVPRQVPRAKLLRATLNL